MDPFVLQKQLKENASDLDQFYKELKSWGEDMKKREQTLKKNTNPDVQISENAKKRRSTGNKIHHLNKEPPTNTKSKKIGYTDYLVWEKFDADAECEKIDYDENESELSDECDEAQRDQAYVEKEKGNKFVQNGNWDEAIICYTKAIDCYSYDPVFYANRALCFLKKENMIKAESDCTMSLKLDNSYVKAYQRRAAAREALNKLNEAEADLLKVLELEPKNKETRDKLDNLRNKMKNKVETTQRPLSKFTASRNQKKVAYNIQHDVSKSNNEEYVLPMKQKVESMHFDNYWPSGNENIILVKTVNKPVHLQSKKPLKRIDISENVKVEKFEQATTFPTEIGKTLRTDDLKVVERLVETKSSVNETLKETKNQANCEKMKEHIEIFVPKSSVQFYSYWKHLKTLDEKYEYMKQIEPNKLPDIFKESLDSQVFSEILEVFVKCFIKHNEKVFGYLVFFSKMKRFSTIIMFMTANDKNHLWKLFDYIKENENQPKEDQEMLFKKYEL